MPVKDWLTIIIVLLIVGIVLDGIRRMRLAKRESIALSRNAKKADLESEFSVSSSEFPSGGARVAAVRDEKVASNLNENVRKKFESQRVTAGAPRRIPEQVSLNLDESVPMLMDSVEEDVDDIDGEETLELQTQNAEEPTQAEDTSDDDYDDPREPAIGDFSELDDDELGEVRAASTTQEARAVEKPPVAEKREVKVEKSAAQEKPQAQRHEPEESSESAFQEPDEVLIINVMAKPGQRIAGTDLLQALMDEGVKFGDMDIFHRHKDNDGDGPILYSIANMVVPGTFNLAEMDDFQTPGISMFLSLPVAGESLAAYNDLASTAKNLANALGAELKDENRSVMTTQTIEHGRQRVIEYERKRKLARA